MSNDERDDIGLHFCRALADGRSENTTVTGRCTRWSCSNVLLVWMRKGDSRQTFNGFLIAKIAGWYCPVCGGGYGGGRNGESSVSET